jgi:hypothetical protein
MQHLVAYLLAEVGEGWPMRRTGAAGCIDVNWRLYWFCRRCGHPRGVRRIAEPATSPGYELCCPNCAEAVPLSA